jgi:hypothetical protein
VPLDDAHDEVSGDLVARVGRGDVHDLECVVAAVDPVTGRPCWGAGAERSQILAGLCQQFVCRHSQAPLGSSWGGRLTEPSESFGVKISTLLRFAYSSIVERCSPGEMKLSPLRPATLETLMYPSAVFIVAS